MQLINIVANQFKVLIKNRTSVTTEENLSGCKHYPNYFSLFSFVYNNNNLNTVTVKFNNEILFNINLKNFSLRDVYSPQSEGWMTYKTYLLDEYLSKFHSCYTNALKDSDTVHDTNNDANNSNSSSTNTRQNGPKVIQITLDCDSSSDDSSDCSSDDTSDDTSEYLSLDSNNYCSCDKSDPNECSSDNSDYCNCNKRSGTDSESGSNNSSIYVHKKHSSGNSYESCDLSSFLHQRRQYRRHNKRHRNYSNKDSETDIKCTCKECSDKCIDKCDDKYEDTCIDKDITCDTVWDCDSVTICGDIHVKCGVTLKIKPFTKVCFSAYPLNEDTKEVCDKPTYAHLTVDPGASVLAYDVTFKNDLLCGKQLTGGLTIMGTKGIDLPEDCEPSKLPCKLEKVVFCNLGNKICNISSLSFENVDDTNVCVKDIFIQGSGANAINLVNSNLNITNLYVYDAFGAAINASEACTTNIDGVLFVSSNTQRGSVIEVSDNAVVNVKPCTFVCLDALNDTLNGVTPVELCGTMFGNTPKPISINCQIGDDSNNTVLFESV